MSARPPRSADRRMSAACTGPSICSSARRSSRRWTPRSPVPARARARSSPSRARAGSARRACWPPRAARAREAGMRTLHARASELERSFTFGVVRQLFEPALFAADAAERDRWLSGAAGLTRSMFEDAGAGHDESSYARLHGLYWLCANLAADAPLLVCVDDAQWADEPSLSFLGFLARRLEDLPVALVLGTRPRAEQESEVLRGLVTDPGTRAPAPARADRRRRRPVGARGDRPVAPAPASAPPATRPRAATRSSSASCCTRCSTSSCTRPTPRPRPCASSAPRRSPPSCCSGCKRLPADRARDGARGRAARRGRHARARRRARRARRS